MKYISKSIVSILFLGFVILSTEISAQEKDTTEYSYKSPFFSTFFSVALPGGGQLYNEEYAKAGAVLLGSGLCVAIFAATFELNIGIGENHSKSNDNTAAGLAAFGLFGIYIYQLIDAPISSCRINRENREKHKKNDIGFIDDNAKLNIKPDIGMKSIGIAVTYHF